MPEGKLILCPYCGHTQPESDRCEECRGLFEPLSRHATQIAMGPWFIRDKAHPFRPGCSYDVIVRQVGAGKIKSTTVMRGPTTRQFWSVARNVPGVAHLLGYCYRCGARVQPDGMSCRECFEQFHEPHERNELGLMYPSPGDATVAQRALDKEMAALAGFGGGAGAPPPHVTAVQQGLTGRHIREEFNPMTRGADLLDEVVSEVKPRAREARQRETAGAPPRVKASPTPAPAPEALSFEPSDETVPAAASDEAVHRRNIWIGVLAVAVVALLAVQIGLFMVWGGEHVNTPPPINPAPEVPPQAVPAPPDGRADTATRNDQAPRGAASPLEPNIDSEVQAPPPKADDPVGDAPADLRERLAEARKLEDAKRYSESLVVLRDAERRTPNARRPAELGEAITRVEDAIRRENAVRFFKDDTN